MRRDAAHLAARLAEDAEAVCKEYLSQGRRCGNYLLVGDVHGNPGRSLFVRLAGPSRGRGAAGHWTDASSGERGDLLDLISLNRGHTNLRDTLEEARAFLGLPARGRSFAAAQVGGPSSRSREPAPRDSKGAARRLFAASRSIEGTLAETYLRTRGITGPLRFAALRFHPDCYYRADAKAPFEAWPALIAAVTDPSGNITGVLRTWLARNGSAKAPLTDPRRAMGQLLGHAVRFGVAQDVVAAGEGIETMLSLKSVLPALPVAAALSASHLAGLLLPPSLRRLYVAADNDLAGRRAATRLIARARETEVEALLLLPRGKDYNVDLCALGPSRVLEDTAAQLRAQDVARFLARDT